MCFQSNYIQQELLCPPSAPQVHTIYLNAYLHVWMVNNWFMHLSQKRKSSSNPVVILFADGHIDYLLFTVIFFLIFLEWKEFEDKGNWFSWMQEKCVAFAYHVVSFRFTVIAILLLKYCSATKYLHSLLFFTTESYFESSFPTCMI